MPEGPNPALHPSRRARPRQFCDVLHAVLDVDVALLAYIEHQMLELLYWRLPMGLGLHQTYADALFDAASDKLGRRVAAPQAILDFEGLVTTPVSSVSPSAGANALAKGALGAVPPLPLAPPQTESVEEDSSDSVLMQELFGAMRVNADEVAPQHQTYAHSKTP